MACCGFGDPLALVPQGQARISSSCGISCVQCFRHVGVAGGLQMAADSRRRPNEGPEVRDDAALDEGIGAAVGAVPEGTPLGKFLKQFGFAGLIIGVLAGNVPVTALISAVVSGKGTITADTFATYWSVFLLVTPWVALFAVIAYCIATQTFPQMNLAGYLLAFGCLVGVAATVSYTLGGTVPVEVAEGPAQGGPAGAGAYAVNSLSAYWDLYGPWPVLAGVVEGGVFGWWAAALTSDEVNL
jgi:hypothetical protein